MKLDKRHMGVSVVLLVASIIYNVWVFTGSGATPARQQASGPIETLPSAQPRSDGNAPVDPAQVKALPDIALDRIPEWPRNPFTDVRQLPDVEVAEVAPPAAIPQADPVVATILYSSDRRAAVIDGRIVRIGDMVGTGKVVDILPKAVIIESPDRGRQTLEMKPGSGTGTGGGSRAAGAPVKAPALPAGRQ